MIIIVYCHLKWSKNYCKEFFYAIARSIGQHGTVVCVDRPLNIIPDIILRPRTIFEWMKSGRAHQLVGNIILFKPMIFIHDQIAKYFKLLPIINRAMIKRQLKKYLRKEDVVLTYIIDPFQYDYLKILDGEISIYDCVAEWSKYPGISTRRARIIQRYENKTLKLSDIVLTVSEELYRRRIKVNSETHYLPWAAEYSFFNRNCANIPDDIKALTKPIVGFIGNVWGIFDLDILEKLSIALNESTLLLIGDLSNILPRGYRDRFISLSNKDNVKWLGYRKHEDLPKYLSAIKVCIMPYKIDDWTLTCSPGKFYQYLAQGKPIVSSLIPEVMKFKDNDIVRIASSCDQFVDEVKNALSESPSENIMNKRIAVAKNNSWDDRAKKMIDIVKAYGN